MNPFESPKPRPSAKPCGTCSTPTFHPQRICAVCEVRAGQAKRGYVDREELPAEAFHETFQDVPRGVERLDLDQKEASERARVHDYIEARAQGARSNLPGHVRTRALAVKHGILIPRKKSGRPRASARTPEEVLIVTN